MENGPGRISPLSVIHLSSSTGLCFHAISPSSVRVYPHSQKDPPREGAMHIEVFANDTSDSDASSTANIYIPGIDPYEKIDLFFDVTAPVMRTDHCSAEVKHEVSSILQTAFISVRENQENLVIYK